MSAIKASEKPLDSVYCRDYVFRIPVYQRPYAWEREHVEALLDDLLAATGRNEDEYFLGSIVLIKREQDPESDVVDGQQRLTTLTMLLCVLRELTDPPWPDNLDERVRQRADVVTGRQEVVRLQLRDRDQEFFYRHIQSRGAVIQIEEAVPATNTDSQERIIENVTHLYQEIRKLSTEQRTKLAQFVINRCYLVVVTTNSESSAYRIFAVMNDRGLDLSPTDILKAEITGAIEDDHSRTEYAQKWEALEERLGRDQFAELFSHIRMIYGKDKQRRNLQEEFRAQVLQSLGSKEFIDNILVPYAEAYEKTVGTDDNVPDEIKPYLRYLSRLDNVDWIAPAMSLFFDPPRDNCTLLEYVKGLERLAYGLFILRANVNSRIARFASLITAIQNQDHSEAQEALMLRKAEKESIKSTLDGPIYGLTRVRLPLLLRLDELMASAGATYDHRIVTIEHVLPQTPGDDSNWIEWFPDEEERADWTHRLANLVLLSRRKNTRAYNFEFDRKKEEYFQRDGVTPFALTIPVLSNDSWTPEVLESRQETLLQKLVNEWDLR